MDPKQLHPIAPPPRAKGQVREGLRYVRDRPHILWLIVLVGLVGTFGYNFAIVLSAYAKHVFHSNADIYGLLNSAMAVGSVVGALLAAKRSSSRIRWLYVLSAGFAVCLVALGFIPWLIPFACILVITGLLSVSFNTTANATVQLSTDAQVRGRVMSLYMLVFAGGTPIGGPIVGAITDTWGAPVAMVACGIICLASTVACGLLAARASGVKLRVDLHRGVDHHVDIVPR